MTLRAPPTPPAPLPPPAALESLRVALVHDWLNGMRGGEKVLEALCEIFPQATIFTLFLERDRLSPALAARHIVESPLARLPGARRCYRHLLPLMPWAVERLATHPFDLVISTSHCVAKSINPPPRGLHICYCFTPMRYMWDLFDDYFPPAPLADIFAPESGWRQWAQVFRAWATRKAAGALRPRLQRWDRATAARADCFVAISKHIASKIQRFYGRSAQVLYPPADTDFFTPPENPDAMRHRRGRPAREGNNGEEAHNGDDNGGDDFDLVVSALVPYKRVGHAIAAAIAAGRRLVIIGEGPERRRLEAMAGPGIEFWGRVDAETLRSAYRRARVLLYPQEEDFGISAVEAQACGCPVVALGRGGALETVRDGETGILYSEPTPEALARALEDFNPAQFDPAACRRQAELFDRPRFLREMRQCIESALARRA